KYTLERHTNTHTSEQQIHTGKTHKHTTYTHTVKSTCPHVKCWYLYQHQPIHLPYLSQHRVPIKHTHTQCTTHITRCHSHTHTHTHKVPHTHTYTHITNEGSPPLNYTPYLSYHRVP